MAISDNASYELTGAQVKDLANKIKAKAADNIFVGATSAAPGSKGLVPQPQAGDDAKFLKGDGTWGTPSGGGGGDEVVTYYVNDDDSNDLRDLYKKQSLSSNDFQDFYLESDPYTTRSAYDVYQEIAGGQKTRFVFKDRNQSIPTMDSIYAISDIAIYDSASQAVTIRAEFGYWGEDENHTTRRLGDTTMTAILELDPNDGIRYQDSESGKPLMLYMNSTDFAIQTNSILTGDYVFSSAKSLRGRSQGSRDGDLVNELGLIVAAAIKAGNRIIFKLYNEWSNEFEQTYPSCESLAVGWSVYFAIKQGSPYPTVTKAFWTLASQRPGELTCPQ